MNTKEYVNNAIITESNNFEAISSRLSDKGTIRLLHSGMGIATESAEFVDALKKHVYYGKELDRVNLAEEIGDIFWYLAIASDELGVDFESIMNTNIAKLKARYGEKFTEHAAEVRNLTKEREILETGSA